MRGYEREHGGVVGLVFACFLPFAGCAGGRGIVDVLSGFCRTGGCKVYDACSSGSLNFPAFPRDFFGVIFLLFRVTTSSEFGDLTVGSTKVPDLVDGRVQWSLSLAQFFGVKVGLKVDSSAMSTGSIRSSSIVSSGKYTSVR